MRRYPSWICEAGGEGRLARNAWIPKRNNRAKCHAMAQPALELPGLLPSTAPLPASLCTLSQRAAVFSPEVQGSWTAAPTAVLPLQKRAPHRTLLHSRCSGHCPQQGPENSQKQTQTPEFKTMPFNREISASKARQNGSTLGGRTAPVRPQKKPGRALTPGSDSRKQCLQRVPRRQARRRKVGRQARDFSAHCVNSGADRATQKRPQTV